MRKSYMFAGGAIVCWSTIATITKLLLSDVNGFQLLWVSSFLAAIFLFIVVVASKKQTKLAEYTLKDYVIMVLIGFPGTFLYYAFYYAGSEFLSASQAFIINYLWPIMSVLFACIILKERRLPLGVSCQLAG